ncbi:hypothetical protein Tco_0501952, partial [Tanacetum coccineum]
VECCLGKAVKDSSELHPAIEEIDVYNPTTGIQVLNKAMAVADKVLNVPPVPEFNTTTSIQVLNKIHLLKARDYSDDAGFCPFLPKDEVLAGYNRVKWWKQIEESQANKEAVIKYHNSLIQESPRISTTKIPMTNMDIAKKIKECENKQELERFINEIRSSPTPSEDLFQDSQDPYDDYKILDDKNEKGQNRLEVVLDLDVGHLKFLQQLFPETSPSEMVLHQLTSECSHHSLYPDDTVEYVVAMMQKTIKPFGCPVTILNTRDHLGKFNGKADEEFFYGFLENAPNVKGNRPDWLFDVDSLTISMNYVPVVTGNQTNGIAGTKDNIVAGQAENKKEPAPEYILIPFCKTGKSVHLWLVNLRCMSLYFTLCTKGTMRINERGFEIIGVTGIGNESLYIAVSHGLMGDEGDYMQLFKIGMMRMSHTNPAYNPYVNAYGMWAVDPLRVLKALDESLSIRIMVFNAKDEILTELLPTPDTEIKFIAYVLCVPTISNVTKAYALEVALPILTPQPTNNNAPEEVLRQNRIFTVNFDLTLSKFEIVQAQVIVKKMIKQKDSKFEMYFVREMLATP